MAEAVFKNIKISGLVGAIPKHIVYNRDFGPVFGEKIVERFIQTTGVEQFRRAERCQTASDLGYAAAEHLLTQLQIERSEIGAILFFTHTPDYMYPASAQVLQNRLKLSTECLAFDVNLACSGFVYGLHVAASLLQNMKQKYILLLSGMAEKHPNFLEREHPDTANVMMFGDACTALLLERVSKADETKETILETELGTDGSGYRMLIRGGMSRSVDASDEVSVWSDGIERSVLDSYMDGMGVFAFSTEEASKNIHQFLKKREQTIDNYDMLYLHQANKIIVERIAKKVHADMSKVPCTFNKYGNVSSASIPLTIIDDMGTNKSTNAKKILLCGFGTGLSWGCVSAYITPNVVFPVIETDEYFAEGELTKR